MHKITSFYSFPGSFFHRRLDWPFQFGEVVGIIQRFDLKIQDNSTVQIRITRLWFTGVSIVIFMQVFRRSLSQQSVNRLSFCKNFQWSHLST
jgi:hypothetical protein